jgi:hypothetical protein
MPSHASLSQSLCYHSVAKAGPNWARHDKAGHGLAPSLCYIPHVMTQVLTPSGPFLLILWNPVARTCSIKGTLENKALTFEILARAKNTLEEHYDELAKANLVQRPKVTLTDGNN